MPFRKIQVDVRPCPCCGHAKVEASIQSATTYGVRCPDCGLKMERSMPDKWPRGLWKKDLSETANWSNLAEFTLRKAVEAWNNRDDVFGTTSVTGYVET